MILLPGGIWAFYNKNYEKPILTISKHVFYIGLLNSTLVLLVNAYNEVGDFLYQFIALSEKQIGIFLAVHLNRYSG